MRLSQSNSILALAIASRWQRLAIGQREALSPFASTQYEKYSTSHNSKIL